MAKIILLYNDPIPKKQAFFSAYIKARIHHSFKIIKCLQLMIQIHIVWRLQYFLISLKTYIEKSNVFLLKIFRNKRPLMYSCSHVAKMANYLSLELDKKGSSNISCVAGFGSNLKSLVGEISVKGKVVNFN